jgi:hypothetical protein
MKPKPYKKLKCPRIIGIYQGRLPHLKVCYTRESGRKKRHFRSYQIARTKAFSWCETFGKFLYYL